MANKDRHLICTEAMSIPTNEDFVNVDENQKNWRKVLRIISLIKT